MGKQLRKAVLQDLNIRYGILFWFVLDWSIHSGILEIGASPLSPRKNNPQPISIESRGAV
jgi:hypothetical protein